MRVPKEILEIFLKEETFYVLGHMEPDGDCIGSQLGLTNALKELGKTAFAVSPGPFFRPEVRQFEEYFKSSIPIKKLRDSVLVIVDCSTQERLGDLEHLVKESKCTIVIDHHKAGSEYGDLRWVEPEAPAATLMVQVLLEEMQAPLSEQTASHLFYGFATDTGFFRHLDATSHASIRKSADLVEAGVSPKKIYGQLNGGRDLGTLILVGRILSRSSLLAGGKILYSEEILGEREELGVQSRESDLLYQLFMSLDSVELVILLRQESADKVTGGLRSRTIFPCDQLASDFGGGGHARASGFATQGQMASIKTKILEKSVTLLSK